MLNTLEKSDSADALKHLRNYIAMNDLKAGHRLPSERDLISKLGVTRNMLRKALDALEREGRIWRHVGKGTFVAASESDLEQILEPPVKLGQQLTPFKMMRARISIEPAIAREAAINASGEVLERMHLAMKRAREASNWELYEEQDDEFHRAIAEGSDNLLLLAIFDQLNLVRRAVAWGNVTRETTKPPKTHSSFAEHEAIAQAITARDGELAHDLMRSHLRGVFGRLFKDL